MSQSIEKVGLRDQDSDTHVDLVTFEVSNPVQEQGFHQANWGAGTLLPSGTENLDGSLSR